jgi:hypothetical protein
MMPGAASRLPGWRARVVTVVIAVATLGLYAFLRQRAMTQSGGRLRGQMPVAPISVPMP